MNDWHPTASRPFIGPPSAPTASDEEILSWSRVNGCVLLTHDLDFSAILAGTSEVAPSVVQLRMQDLLSEPALEAIVTAVNAHAKEIELGALVSIDESGSRVRILPLRQH